MLKKLIYFIGIILFHMQISFASYYDEDITIQTPQRLGFNGSLTTIGLKNVRAGPSDDYFSLIEHPSIYPVAKGHMAFIPSTTYGTCYSTRQWETLDFPLQPLVKDSISSYGIARLTFNSYEEQCLELGLEGQLRQLRVEIDPHDLICELESPNAYYQRTSNAGQGHIKCCTPLTFDLIAHETGHSICDVLQPNLYGFSDNHPYAALHESFGDLSAIFASAKLAKSAQIKSFLKEDGNDMCIVPGWDGMNCLRTPQTYKGTSCEAHDHSNYFTSFFGNSMSNIFSNLDDTGSNAQWTVNFFQKLLIYTVRTFEPFENLYAFGNQMIKKVPILLPEQDDKWLQSLISKTMITELNKKKSTLKSCSI